MKKSTFELIVFIITLVGSSIILICRFVELDLFNHFFDFDPFKPVYSKWEVLWPYTHFIWIMSLIAIIIELIFYKKK